MRLTENIINMMFKMSSEYQCVVKLKCCSVMKITQDIKDV